MQERVRPPFVLFAKQDRFHSMHGYVCNRRDILRCFSTTFFATLPMYPDVSCKVPAVNVNVAQLESDQFEYPDASVVEQQEHKHISMSKQCVCYADAFKAVNSSSSETLSTAFRISRMAPSGSLLSSPVYVNSKIRYFTKLCSAASRLLYSASRSFCP